MIAHAVLFIGLDQITITGRVTDAKHNPIPAAKVIILQDGKQITQGLTNQNGTYTFTLPDGKYTIRAQKDNTEASTTNATPDLVLQPKPAFFDEPQFTVAGVTDNTYRGGHGADTVLRSTESLTKETAALSDTNTKSSNPLEAVKAFQTAAEQDPSEPNLFNWATELLIHRAPQAAAQVFTKGIRLFPTSLRMLLGLATSQYAAGNYAEAAHCYFEASDLAPSNPLPYQFLSKLQASEIISSPSYLEHLARFAKIQPDNAEANYYYAHATLRDNPLALLQKALQINPHLAPAYLDLGIVQAAQHRFPEAIAAYQSAIKEDPTLEEAHYRLSEAYRLSGDKSKAAQELTQYRQLSSQSEQNRELERRQLQQFIINLQKK